MASDAPGAPRGPRGGLRELASPGLASPTALADAQEGQGRRGLRRRRDDDGDGGERTGDPGGAGEAKDDGVASKPQVFAVAGVYDLAEAHGALEKPLGLAATIPVVCTIIDDLLTTGLPEIINHKGATYYELAGPREPARYDAGALKSQVKFSRGNRLLLLFEHALRGYVAFVLKNDLELQVDGDDASDRGLVLLSELRSEFMDKVAVVVGKLVAKWKATSAKQKSYLQRRVDEAAEARAEARAGRRGADEEPGGARPWREQGGVGGGVDGRRRGGGRRRGARVVLHALLRELDGFCTVAERTKPSATEGEAVSCCDGLTVSRFASVVHKLAEAVVAGVPTADEAEDLLKVFSRVRALGVVEHDRLHGVFHVLHLVLKQDFEFQGRALVQARNLTKVGPSGAEAGQEVRKKLHHVRVRLAGTFLALLAAFYADEAYRERFEALSRDALGKVAAGQFLSLIVDYLSSDGGGGDRHVRAAAALEEEDYGGGLVRNPLQDTALEGPPKVADARPKPVPALLLLLRGATRRLHRRGPRPAAASDRPAPASRHGAPPPGAVALLPAAEAADGAAASPPADASLTEQDQALQAQQDVLLSERAAILLELGKVSDEKAGLVAQGKVRALRNTATLARNCDAKAKKLKASRDKVGRALSKINKQRRELQRQVLAEAAESDDESFNSADCDDDDSAGDFDSASESDDDVHIRNHDAAAFSQSDDESDDDGPAPPKRSKTPPPGS
ncbi:hypothetical protein JL722_5361 [Aureococcus anophagefferens]|nr:hypothetical protein JL722_5361 [Aureococcus anophagefferens]